MARFDALRILVAVTAGIAAYKACDLIRQLYREGAQQVVVMMTPAACSFVSPLTFESLTRHKVFLDEMDVEADGTPSHIWLAQHMDALIVVPASANTLAKMAMGMADTMVTTTALSFTGKPTVIAPAMNTRMWNNPAVQRNVAWLQALPNVDVVAPAEGLLACGETGEGKLADHEALLAALYRAVHPQRGIYSGKHIIVTAGGTVEPIDEVRTLTNRSSGKMGMAVADELWAMGADVTLVHTVGQLTQKPYSTAFVQTVEEMAQITLDAFDTADGVVMTAAVSDFKAEIPFPGKIKKQQQYQLDLIKTRDILSELGERKRADQFLVGFGAECDHLDRYGREKMARKRLDMMVVNDVSRNDIGFGADENEVLLLFEGQPPIHVAKADKRTIARQILVQLHQYVLQPQADSDRTYSSK